MNIILMGVKHCGKSTLGRRLAALRQVRFVDIDELLRQLPGTGGLGVRELYAQRGRAEFEDLEARAVIEFCWRSSREPFVMAPGGGIIENSVAMAFLSGLGLKIYLEAEADELFARIMTGGIPAFLSQKDPYPDFLRLYKRRSALYKKDADLILPVAGKSREDSFRALKSTLDKYTVWKG